jgi:hypothetical protein
VISLSLIGEHASAMDVAASRGENDNFNVIYATTIEAVKATKGSLFLLSAVIS